MASVFIVAGRAGCAVFRASVLTIAVAAPAAVFEAVVGVGVTGIAAKAARCASSVLGIRAIFPTSVFQRMVLRSAGADVGIADAAIFFDCMLRFIIFIVFRACAVATVLIFSTTAAIVASAIPAMLAGRVIFPITIGIRAVGRAPINDFAAVPANFFPITSIPRCIGIVVLTGCIFFVAAFGTNTARVEAMGLRVAIRILVCAAIRTALPDVMLGFILLLIIVGEAARRAVTTGNAASAGGNHKNGVCRNKGDAFCVKNAHRDLIAGYDFERRHIYARKCSIRNVKTIVVVVQLQPIQICAILEYIRAKVCKRGQDARFQIDTAREPVRDIRYDHVRAGIKFYACDVFPHFVPRLVFCACERSNSAVAGDGKRAAVIQRPRQVAGGRFLRSKRGNAQGKHHAEDKKKCR